MRKIEKMTWNLVIIVKMKFFRNRWSKFQKKTKLGNQLWGQKFIKDNNLSRDFYKMSGICP